MAVIERLFEWGEEQEKQGGRSPQETVRTRKGFALPKQRPHPHHTRTIPGPYSDRLPLQPDFNFSLAPEISAIRNNILTL